ncbi:dirigent protein 22-like [Triticum dicoccoides]|uniref:dirigent protein 22-like n=1 Tax=Triticum dicoccoides TaxID=85692 RepID=UPI00188E95C6|nr:dirigent protein 22-like [Triticum dicoccoides]
MTFSPGRLEPGRPHAPVHARGAHRPRCHDDGGRQRHRAVVLLGLRGEPPVRFRQVVVMDDALTEGPSPASRPVGRTQGFYVFSSLREPVLLFSMNVVLMEGPHSGSTFTVAGRHNMVEPLRELSVVGGTGRFRMATGYVLWRTVSWEMHEKAVIELDVFVYLHANSHA